MKQLLTQEFKGMIYFISESVQTFLVYIFSIAAIWLWLPFNYGIKLVLIIFVILNFYNIMRHFIYLRYSLWKETLNQPKKTKWEDLE